MKEQALIKKIIYKSHTDDVGTEIVRVYAENTA